MTTTIGYYDVVAHVVVALGVDQDRYVAGSATDAEEILARTIETMIACRNALMRVRKS